MTTSVGVSEMIEKIYDKEGSMVAPPGGGCSVLEMGEAYPETSGVVGVPRHEEMLDVDASQLHRLLWEMGASLERVQSKEPSWVEEMGPKLARVEALDHGFAALTEVVSNLMAMVREAPDEARSKRAVAELEAVKALRASSFSSSSKGDESGLGWAKESVELKASLLRLERRVRAAPSKEDVEGLKDFVKERTKKLKATSVKFQADAQRSIEGLFQKNLDTFGDFQGSLTQVTDGKIRQIREELAEIDLDLKRYKKQIEKELDECHSGTEQLKKYTTKEIASLAKQLLSVELALERTCERVSSVEDECESRKAEIEASRKSCTSEIHRIDTRLAAQAKRIDDEAERLTDVAKKLQAETDKAADVFTTLNDAVAKIDLHSTALELNESDIKRSREHAHTVDATLKQLTEQASSLSAFVHDFTTAQEKRDAEVSRTLDAHRKRTDILTADFNTVRDTVKDHPDKFERLLETVDDIQDRAEQSESDAAAVEKRLADLLKKTPAAAAVQGSHEEAVLLKAQLHDAETKHQQTLAEVAALKTELANFQDKADANSERLELQVRRFVSRLDQADGTAKDHEVWMADLKDDLRTKTAALARNQTRIEKDLADPDSALNKSYNLRTKGRAQFFGASPFASGSSVARANPEEREKFASDQASDVAKACVQYELLCVEKNVLVTLSDDVVRQISAAAMEMAAFIADKVDAWAVARAVAADVDGLDDDDMAERRRSESRDWIKLVKSQAAELARVRQGDDVSPLELQARDRFILRLAKALDMFLSKHDAVFLGMQASGFSGKGQTNVPVCVACDRPLPKRSRRVNATNPFEDEPCSSPSKKHPGALRPRRVVPKTPSAKDRPSSTVSSSAAAKERPSSTPSSSTTTGGTGPKPRLRPGTAAENTTIEKEKSVLSAGGSLQDDPPQPGSLADWEGEWNNYESP